MMNRNKRIEAVVTAMIISLSVWGQNKVYWVHGLGDDETTWNTYKSALIPEENQGTSIRWSSGSSLEAAAGKLNTRIASEVSSSSKAIVFGHSAGGLVARRSAQTNNAIRAIITAGTPNNGAGIVKSLNDQSINNVAEKAISRAEASFSLSFSAIGTILPGLGKMLCSLIACSSTILGEIATSMGNDYMDEIKNDFKGKAAVSDMNPSMAVNRFLCRLNASTPSVPIINLYGNEDDNKLVRIAGTCLHKEENDSPENTTDNCYDETLFDAYDDVLAACSSFQLMHSIVAVTMSVAAIFCPYYSSSVAMNSTAASSWAATERYLQYDVHNDWDSIIGAVHTDSIENWHKFLWWNWCTVKTVTVYENSDGFIPNKSSIMDESKGPKTRNYELKGVNHLEMNSHSLMRRRLNEILNGGLYGSEYRYSL